MIKKEKPYIEYLLNNYLQIKLGESLNVFIEEHKVNFCKPVLEY
jgi:hypothetical protein